MIRRNPRARTLPHITIRKKPDFARAYENLGETYLEMGQREKAMAIYEILRTLDQVMAKELSDKMKSPNPQVQLRLQDLHPSPRH